jgi:hypothetical protein
MFADRALGCINTPSPACRAAKVDSMIAFARGVTNGPIANAALQVRLECSSDCLISRSLPAVSSTVSNVIVVAAKLAENRCLGCESTGRWAEFCQ